MDYILDIIINKQEIQSAGLTEKLCEWDGNQQYGNGHPCPRVKM